MATQTQHPVTMWLADSSNAYDRYEAQVSEVVAAQREVDDAKQASLDLEHLLKECENELLLPELLAPKGEGRLNGSNADIREMQAAVLLREDSQYQAILSDLNTVKVRLKNAEAKFQEATLRLTGYRHLVALKTAQLQLIAGTKEEEHYDR